MKAHLYRVENQDALATARVLLQRLWQIVELDRMFIPTWENGEPAPRGELVDDPTRLDRADPFAPIMPSTLPLLHFKRCRVNLVTG